VSPCAELWRKTRRAITLKTLAGESKAEREQFVNSTLGLLMFETAPSFIDPTVKHQAVEGYCALAESCLLRSQVAASSRSGGRRSCWHQLVSIRTHGLSSYVPRDATSVDRVVGPFVLQPWHGTNQITPTFLLADCRRRLPCSCSIISRHATR
jgi:hypothetical protein